MDMREWLTTNGLGGYASGTVSGANTRRYHGLLIAALRPPDGRTTLLSHVEERVTIPDGSYELSTNVWRTGAVAPRGFEHIRAFNERPVPHWQLDVGGARLTRWVAAVRGHNATAIGYRLDGPVEGRLELAILANDRTFHGRTQGHPDWHFSQQFERSNRLRILAREQGTPWWLSWSQPGEYTIVADWYWGYRYPEEELRGLPADEDVYCTGTVRLPLKPGDAVTLLASTEPELALEPIERVVAGWAEREQQHFALSTLPDTPAARALVAAADQFIVQRASTGSPTIIAGYHWFGEWGRDAMISLPGLTLTTGRLRDGAGILRTFSRYVQQGLIPNYIPDSDHDAVYNTADATLWWFHALDRYWRATSDLELLREQFSVLSDVVDWHQRGTRHGIQMDPEDGLLWAGEPGMQLTWMDVKIGDWVVTPRDGKPIEIQALWYNALCVMAEFATELGRYAAGYRALASQARKGLQKFWMPERGYLADVLTRDGTMDPSPRPNQLIALALPHRAFLPSQERAVLRAVDESLLTPFGLRTLDPTDPAYRPTCSGDEWQRDSAYHQGTVWPWLLGPYADALVNVNGLVPETLETLKSRLEPLLNHMWSAACLGSVSEIFDAEPPHTPRGCVAQAWSIAELLRVYAMSVTPVPPRGATARLAR
ncbi:MAG: glycogen debranching enzyme family protein [Chloroflexi bacterium]|nr:glycogen debranching enzyme family protein [Chloroflexota bacterium]